MNPCSTGCRETGWAQSEFDAYRKASFFALFRGILTTHKELAAKFEELEQRVSQHDQALFDLMQAIKSLMTPPAPKKRPIGFTVNIEGNGK